MTKRFATLRRAELALIVGAIAALATLVTDIDKIRATLSGWFSARKPGVQVVELAISPDQRVWMDLSDQIPALLVDLRRLERREARWERSSGTGLIPDHFYPFDFGSSRYRGTRPRYPMEVCYPIREFMLQSKRLFDWDEWTEPHDPRKGLLRDPLLVNIGIRNNTDREITITRAVFRINKARFVDTSLGDATPLIPDHHQPPASLVRFEWPISQDEIEEFAMENGDYPVIAHREDIAYFRDSLVIRAQGIARIATYINMPSMY